MEHAIDYVRWFRNSAPYINAHRGRTFVIHFAGEAVLADAFPALIHDFALLNSLGVRLVLVHGTRPQIETRLKQAGFDAAFHDGVRITSAEVLPAVVEASAATRIQIESLLSMGLANSPMAGARLRIASGNFLIARPRGVHSGVDFANTGEVRRIDTEGIRQTLDNDAIVIVSPLGYSPTGEVFNLYSEDVATAIAVELRAAKLIFLSEHPRVDPDRNPLPEELPLEQAKAVLNRRRHAGRPPDGSTQLLANAVHACRNGVNRVHLLDRARDGALLLELFTRDGVGTLINSDHYDAIRHANTNDIGGILELIEPLEREGALIRRSRDTLENEIEKFLVVERDGAIIACAALYPQEAIAELACLAVNDRYRKAGRGDVLLEAIEVEARGLGATALFVLTTQATHWFKERGFQESDRSRIPESRCVEYDSKRNSRVMIKQL